MNRPDWRSVPCDDFPGKLSRDGYGIQSKHGQQNAHRVAWVEAYGPIPLGLHVLHHCDRRCCREPLHLFLGDNGTNVADRQAKQRQARGETYGTSKLTTAQVLYIAHALRNGARGDVLARDYGVAPCTITGIKHGRTWGWLTGAKEAA